MRVAARWLASAAAALLVLGVAVAAVVGDVGSVVGGVSVLAFPVVALVIARVQPGNAVAWCFLASAFLLGLERAGTELTTLGRRDGWPDAVVHVFAWADAWAWFPGLFVLVTVALLRFPDGSLPSRRWRWVEVLSYAAMAVWTLCIGGAAVAVPVRVLESDAAPGGRGVVGALFLTGEAMFGFVAVAAVASFVSLAVRYRRSGIVQREQIRWVLFAACLAILLEAGLDTWGTLHGGETPAWVQSIGEGIGFTLIAVATAIAITRYKLYEIERLVSRTVTYALVLVVLGALYLAVVIGLADVVPADLGSVWVAAATLLVSVVAVPLTRRVRRVVDRRFNRSRFDADRVVTAFASRLRSRPDEGDVPAELLDVLDRTVQPAHAGIWLVPR